MGCCGSTVDVQEMQPSRAASSDEESDGDDMLENYSSETMIHLKSEARRMFAMVDEGAWLSLWLSLRSPVSQHLRNVATRRATAIDGSGQLDRGELRQLVELLVTSDYENHTATGSGGAVSEAELDAAMFEMDDDASGTITFKEFYSWWRAKQERDMQAKNCWALTDVEKVDIDNLDGGFNGTRLSHGCASVSNESSANRSPVAKTGQVFTKEAEIAMAELGISGERTQKKGRRVRRTSVVAMAEAELAHEDAAWTVSSAVINGKGDEARVAQEAVKTKQKRKARRARWTRRLNCILCATSDRKKAHKNRKKALKNRSKDDDDGFQSDARRECRKMFDRVDSDGSGLLDIDEIPKLARRLGVELTSEQQQEAMQEMDADGSGEIDFEEFWQWWEKTGGADDGKGVKKHQNSAVGEASIRWARRMNIRSSMAQQHKRNKELKRLASRPGMSVDAMKKVSAGQKEVHSSSVWLKSDKKSGVTMWGRKSSGPAGTLGNWETAIETRPQQWRTMSLWMHESDHAFVE